MHRVTLREGKLPIILFAPHGFNGDDENTAKITECIATEINTFSVINHGWERGDKVDCLLDKADCNNVNHCMEDVVNEEIMEPLLRFVSRAKKINKTVFVYNIHGMSDRHRTIAKDEIDMVIGFGDGEPPSFSMDLWRKNYFVHKMNLLGINAYAGKSGGPFSGWSKSNMNQLFRKWNVDHGVQSLQIEITHELRSDSAMCSLTAEYLATAMLDMLTVTNFNSVSKYKSY